MTTPVVIIKCSCGSIAELQEDYLTVLCLGECGLKSVKDPSLHHNAVTGSVVDYVEFVGGFDG